MQVQQLSMLGMTLEEGHPDNCTGEMPDNVCEQVGEITSAHVMAPLPKASTVSSCMEDYQPELEGLASSGDDFNVSRDDRAVQQQLAECVYVHDTAAYTVIERQGVITNASELRYNPGNARKPFIVKVDITNMYKKRHTSVDGDMRVPFQGKVAVSISWMMEHFHPAVIGMAMNKTWRPSHFTPNAEGGMPLFNPRNGGAEYMWPHHTWANAQIEVGAEPGEAELACARKSMQIALNALQVNDIGVQQELEKWPEMIAWNDLRNHVVALNKVPSHKNRHSIQGLRGKQMNLLQTPLGRSLLFEAGYRSMILRPVNYQGWSLHVNALTADGSGKWTLHDPLVHGSKHPVLWGTLPVCRIMSVYLVVVRPKVVHPKRHCGPSTAKKPKVAASLDRVMPAVPSDADARDHYACAQLDVAFRAFVAYSGVEVNGNEHSTCQNLCPQSQRESMLPFNIWQLLAGKSIMQNIEYSSLSPDTFHYQFPYPAYRTTFYVVGGETRHGLPGLEDTFLVRVVDRRPQIFSPQKLNFEPFQYKSFVGNKLSWVMEIVYKAPLCRN